MRSPDPKDAPILRINYLQSKSDVRLLVAGIKLTRKLFHTSAFDKFRGKEVAPGADVTSDEALFDYIWEVCNTVYHPLSTCKMGTDPMAVVDPELRVHGRPPGKAEGRGQKVDVTVDTRMKCLLPCLAHNGSKPPDLSGTAKNLLRDAQREEQDVLA